MYLSRGESKLNAMQSCIRLTLFACREQRQVTSMRRTVKAKTTPTSMWYGPDRPQWLGKPLSPAQSFTQSSKTVPQSWATAWPLCNWIFLSFRADFTPLAWLGRPLLQPPRLSQRRIPGRLWLGLSWALS